MLGIRLKLRDPLRNFSLQTGSDRFDDWREQACRQMNQREDIMGHNVFLFETWKQARAQN